MTVITEGQRTGEHLVSEAMGYRSREQVILLPGVNKAGTVLGRVPVTANPTASAVAGTGNGAMSAITANADAIQGVYLLKVTKAAANAGDFELFDPQGDVAGVGTVGAAFAGGGLSFTLADGSSDFVVGDTIKITVLGPAVKYVQLAPAATDGSQHAAGIQLADAGLVGVQSRAVAHVRACEVNANYLIWPAGITIAQQALATAELASVGVIVRA